MQLHAAPTCCSLLRRPTPGDEDVQYILVELPDDAPASLDTPGTRLQLQVQTLGSSTRILVVLFVQGVTLPALMVGCIVCRILCAHAAALMGQNADAPIPFTTARALRQRNPCCWTQAGRWCCVVATRTHWARYLSWRSGATAMTRPQLLTSHLASSKQRLQQQTVRREELERQGMAAKQARCSSKRSSRSNRRSRNQKQVHGISVTLRSGLCL